MSAPAGGDGDRDGTPALAAGCDQPPVRLYDVALLDLDGVVYVGPDAVPGVPDALRAARSAGMRLGFVTNNASRTPDEVARHLVELDVEASADDVITSSQAAATVIAARFGEGAAVLPVGGPGLAAALADAGLRVVDTAEDRPAAVAQGYGRDVGWTALAEAVVAVRGGAVHVATNTDATIPSPRGLLPGNGALVGVVSGVTGQEPLVTGKPDPAMHAECVRRTGAERPLVVGDRLDTDIEGARRGGAPSLLVLTGVTDATGLLAAPPDRRPDLLAPDVSGLLTPHPPVRPAGEGWRCGAWTATVTGDGALQLAADDHGQPDGHQPGGDQPDGDDQRGGDQPGGDQPGGDGRDAAGDGLDGLRALCVAWWAGGGQGAPASVRARGAAATGALDRWGLCHR